MSISYTWTKDGLPISSNPLSGQRLVSDGPRLNISRLSRNDAGVYVCEALNTQGTALLEIQVIVECKYSIVGLPSFVQLCSCSVADFACPLDAPVISSVTEGQSFAPGEQAVLACQVQARPLEAAHVRWSRPGYDFATRTTSSFENNTALLHIDNVQRGDIGNFTCTVDNQRGPPASRNVVLVVQSKWPALRLSSKQLIIH